MEFHHLPVLLTECMDGLRVAPGGEYLDCTLGGGGHTLEILRRGGRVTGIDRDADAIDAASRRIAAFLQENARDAADFRAIRGNFHDAAELVGAARFDGILADLGVSSFQLDCRERGFSYHEDAPLDMRMDASRGKTAADIVNAASEDELTRIFRDYGEENWARQIARVVVDRRPIETTLQLVAAIDAAIPKKVRARDGSHPARRVFQALRIAVNDELEPLRASLEMLAGLLKPGGRLCVIAFHSLEDRIVKNAFRTLADPCTCPKNIPVCVCGKKPVVRLITRKPITAGEVELEKKSPRPQRHVAHRGEIAMKYLDVPSGRVPLPAFFPDATYAAVRAASFADVEAAGLFGLEMNTYHLMTKPGARLIKSLGGLHGFSGYKGAILTDSGGFQLYSLIRENPEYGEIRENEIIFRPDRKERMVYTPEKCVTAQLQFGSDIIMALDMCTHPDDGAATQRRSVELTVRWGARCRAEFDRLTAKREKKPLILGIVQGGGDPELRLECGERLEKIGFDGYGFGGWPLDSEGKLRLDVLKMAADAMPDHKLKYAMGLGKPEEIVACVEMGYRLFDCVIPTREARHNRLYAFLPGMDTAEGVRSGRMFYRYLYPMDADYCRDGRSVDETCDCALCRGHSRAYLNHLLKMGDPYALHLMTAHNLRFYGRLMELLRDGEA